VDTDSLEARLLSAFLLEMQHVHSALRAGALKFVPAYSLSERNSSNPQFPTREFCFLHSFNISTYQMIPACTCRHNHNSS
jgi:hypothetical protein